MTNHWNDIDNASAILVMGANPAENHPACMAHINAARFGSKHAKLIVVDPRKTRTAQQADTYIRIRPGTDIAFFNGVMKWVFDNIATYNATAWANMQTYHNTSTDVMGASSTLKNAGVGEFARTLALDTTGAGTEWTKAQWAAAYYDSETTRTPFAHGWPKYTDARVVVDAPKKDYRRGTLHINSVSVANVPYMADSFTDSDTVFDSLKTHVAYYSDAVVTDICGCTATDIETVGKFVIDNSRFNSTVDFGLPMSKPSDPDYKAMTWLYAMGQTQSTVGSQKIRGGAILQTVMGNMGRAGGGVNALRGIHNVQGSTDMGLLFDSIPAYSGNPGQDDTFAGYQNQLFGNRVAGPGKDWTVDPYGTATASLGLQQQGFKYMTQKFFADGAAGSQSAALTIDVAVAPAAVFTMGDTIAGTVYNGFAGMQIANRAPDAVSTDAYLVSVAGFKPTKAAVDLDPTLVANAASWDTLVFRTSNPGVFSKYTYVGKSDAQATFYANTTGKQPESGAFANDADTYYAFINDTDGALYKLSSTDGLTWTWIGRVNSAGTDPQLTEPRVIRDGLGGFWVWGIEVIGTRTGKIIYSHLEKESDTVWSFVKSDGTAGYDYVTIDGAIGTTDGNPFVVYSSGQYQLYWTRGGDVYMSQGTKKSSFGTLAVPCAKLIHDSSAVGTGGYENGIIAGGSSICYTKYANFSPSQPYYFPFNDVKSIQKPWVNKTDALFSLWPKNNGYDHVTSFRKMKTGSVKACYVLGQNPAVTEPNQSEVRLGLKNLDLLVVQDIFETETAACDRKGTGVTYLLPSCSHVEEAGSVTNSGRWLQWREKATEPKGSSKADLELILRLTKQLDSAHAFDHISDVWTKIGFTPAVSRWASLFGRYASNGSAWDGTSSIEGIFGSRPSGASGNATLTGTEYVADVIFEEMCKPNPAAAPLNDGATMWIYCRAYNTARASERPAGAIMGQTDFSVTLSGTATVNLGNADVPAIYTVSNAAGTVFYAPGDYVLTTGAGVLPSTIARSATSAIPDNSTVLVTYPLKVAWPEANRAKARDNINKGPANTYTRWGWAWLYNRRVFYNNFEVPCDEADAFVAPGFLARLFTISTNTMADFTAGLSYRYYSSLADKASVNNGVGQRHYLTGRFPGHVEPTETPRDGTNLAVGTDLVSTWGRNLWLDGNGKSHPCYPTLAADGQTPDTLGGVPHGTAHDYPLVLTTIRCVEHFQGGPITRNNTWNVEAEPVPWIEINSDDALKYSIVDGQWVNITTARSNSTTDQMAETPDNHLVWARGFKARVGVGLQSNQRVAPGVVAIPWHWGDKGLSTGSRANDLCIDASDANTKIPEYKACLCKIVGM